MNQQILAAKSLLESLGYEEFASFCKMNGTEPTKELYQIYDETVRSLYKGA